GALGGKNARIIERTSTGKIGKHSQIGGGGDGGGSITGGNRGRSGGGTATCARRSISGGRSGSGSGSSGGLSGAGLFLAISMIIHGESLFGRAFCLAGVGIGRLKLLPEG